nr:MAG: hypothetical protein DIU56_13040 [Pseudomonadota bacterium]
MYQLALEQLIAPAARIDVRGKASRDCSYRPLTVYEVPRLRQSRRSPRTDNPAPGRPFAAGVPRRVLHGITQ